MNAIEFDHVSVSLNNRTILHDLNWSLPRGSRSVVLGANGSGKSTLMRVVAGYQYPTQGTVQVLGRRFGETDLATLRQSIGVVDPTSPWLFDERVSVLEAVLSGFFGNLAPWFNEPTEEQRRLAFGATEAVGLAGKEQQSFATLSTGERRRTLLARVWVQQPELLLLDEPTAGLDLRAREEFLSALTRFVTGHPNATLVMSTHLLEDLLPSTNEVLLLADGRVLAAGAPKKVLSSGIVSRAFGVPVDIHENGGRWHWSVQPGAGKPTHSVAGD